MRPSFDMDALRVVVAGVDLGSFAKAAAKLGRSQSAVSMQLRKLEQQAGKQLFRRSGRGLMTTEAGDVLLAYARRIVTLNDEAAASLGSLAADAAVRVGLPQDFVEQVIPDAIKAFAQARPEVHIELRAGRNYQIEDDVRSGRLDIGVAFCPPGNSEGEWLATLPTRWLASNKLPRPEGEQSIPLVLYDHPCLFRQAAVDAMDKAGLAWRLALTTPSLPGVWAALRKGLGISVRANYGLPPQVVDITEAWRLPALPDVEVRLFAGEGLSPAATLLRLKLLEILRDQILSTARPLRAVI